MTINLDQAWVYDIEVLPNVFTMDAEHFTTNERSTWEISQYRDDRHAFFDFLRFLNQTQSAMIGFFCLQYDYPVLHEIFSNPQITYQQIYQKSKAILAPGGNRWSHQIYPNKRFAPQIDLATINHFDNKAKSTSLKALQINMRLPSIVESKVGFDVNYTPEQIDGDLIPYNIHDVKSTKSFADICREMIDFRIGLIPDFGIGVLSDNDTKIGLHILEQRLGWNVCYEKINGRKVKRQTIRYAIPLNDIIFPYICFNNPEFQHVLDYLRQQTLTAEEAEKKTDTTTIATKGVFKGLHAMVGGLKFVFGTGGMHASVHSQKYVATDEWLIRDIDVKSLYPSIEIVNKLYPEHLGERFPPALKGIVTEREEHAKGTIRNGALKLGANGAFGNSNNKYSFMFDTWFTMETTINGQLLICMLAEWLLTVPTIELIQCNTDGITYRIHKDHEPRAAEICTQWEDYTCLVLEDADYSRMWIRDVNNYVAEYTDGKLKQKGAYWHPDPLNYAESISKAGPPAWHKDFNPTIVTRAAVMYMTHGITPELFITTHTDPFDFMLRVKPSRDAPYKQLWLGEQQIQKTTRYYITKDGLPMVRVSPPKKGAKIGTWKRASKVPDTLWDQVNAEIPQGAWDERIHTKNKSVYKDRRTAVQAGFLIAECNNAANFDFGRVNYDWYIAEAKKLIIT